MSRRAAARAARSSQPAAEPADFAISRTELGVPLFGSLRSAKERAADGGGAACFSAKHRRCSNGRRRWARAGRARDGRRLPRGIASRLPRRPPTAELLPPDARRVPTKHTRGARHGCLILSSVELLAGLREAAPGIWR
jgi:hypothetical protein